MAAIPVWQPGHFYPNGSLVQPATQVSLSIPALTNAGFESGATDWTLDPGVNIVSGGYEGALRAHMTGDSGDLYVVHDPAPFAAGAILSARAFYKQGGASAGQNVGYIIFRWYDSDMTLIREERGSAVSSGSNNAWHQTSIQKQAPAGTAFVSVGGLSIRTASQESSFDAFSWGVVGTPISGLIYRAVQPDPGYSAPNEPAWPNVPGVQVVDNEVIWEALYANRLIWRARPIMKSGATEPAWPDEVDSEVLDNNISWKMESRRVTDPKAPNSKIVVIDQGKVYAGDDDIVAFSATNNPLDWHAEEDAGYLPFGLGTYGANPISAMGLYRGNLLVFNSQGFQLWQIDPDPALNNRIDAMPIGSIYHRAFQSVSNDSFFLSALGVRTVGIAASSTNIKSGDVGMPIDPLVQPMLRLGMVPISLYHPGAGQYWLIFRIPGLGEEPPTSVVFVHTSTQIGSVGAWSRYIFPFSIDAYAFDGDVLVLRAGNRILEVEEHYDRDLIGDEDEAEIVSTLEWNYLECGGEIGQDKEMEGFDLVSTAEPGFDPQVSFGWDQRDRTKFTPEITVPADSVPDYMIPMELTAPSISTRIVYTGRKWQFSAMNLYLQARRLAR